MDQPSEELLMQAATTRYPSPIAQQAAPLSDEAKITQIAQHFSEIMQLLGLNLADPALAETPNRVARMYVTELFSGLNPAKFPSIRYIENPMTKQGTPNLIFLELSFFSMCEHHFVPMQGKVYVGYYPQEKLFGFSDVSRIVRFFALRPQIQERLTAQIADSLATLLGHEEVAVAIKAHQACMSMRGSEDTHSSTTTHVLRGSFQTNPLSQQEFFAALRNAR